MGSSPDVRPDGGRQVGIVRRAAVAPLMTGARAMIDSAIKVGMIAELTGPLSFMGCANANVAKMVIDDINASGGLLGRKLDLYLEDGATTDSVAEAAAARLVRQVKVDVLFGGIYSSTRQAIKGSAVVEG